MLIAQITGMHVKMQGEMLSGALDSYAALAAAFYNGLELFQSPIAEISTPLSSTNIPFMPAS